MSAAEAHIESEAIRWRLRTPTMPADDWLRLTEWLEADPRHADAYDHVVESECDGDLVLRAAAEAAMGRHDADTDAAGDTIRDAAPGIAAAPRGRRWRLGPGLAVAAGLVAAIGAALTWRPAPVAGERLIATAAGETRTIRLADGSLVAMNGDSRLAIAVDGRRAARLLAGEAAFRIVHHADRPFELQVGSTVLRDVGTYFNVVRRHDGIDVAVAEGAVALDPGKAAILLAAGRAAHLDGDGGTRLADVDPGTVGSWRNGTLAYRDAPLGTVVADLGRSLGKAIAIDPALADRRFSGTIRLSRDEATMRPRLAGLFGLDVDQGATGWHVRSTPRAIP